MRSDAPPTVKQIFAIAAALCDQAGEEFPRDRAGASELIAKLHGETDDRRPQARDP